MVTPLQPAVSLLAHARKHKGWTQAYVAQQVQVSVETVRQWERGRHLPYQATIQQLCDLFQMTPAELGLYTNDPPVCSLPAIDASGQIVAQDRVQLPALLPTDALTRQIAWELYVELSTRIATLPLEQGLLREALSSLHELFLMARLLLRVYSPAVGPLARRDHALLGTLMQALLNRVLGPVLMAWHPRLKDYEDTRPLAVGAYMHEARWEYASVLRHELATLRQICIGYAQIFGQIAGVSDTEDSASKPHGDTEG